jgi:hypothetical protein
MVNMPHSTSKPQNIELGDVAIEEGWVKIRELRRKVVSVTPSLKAAYNEETLLQIFMRGLPQGFATAVETLDMQDTLTGDEKIQKLSAVEERVRGPESAHAAFRRQGSGHIYHHTADGTLELR